MSPRLIPIPGQELARLLEEGFQVVRVRGSHVRLRHPDGRATTVPGDLKAGDPPCHPQGRGLEQGNL
ncbi:type II toxin-antitoxin system HicA family toxin [Thermus islandicus]|uniref:type II toxin-antitoxin system HicA family toxin n=1 Tax=Thermus islandicus TaxID=540988 RepID=UPI0003B7B162|nr:type II toxin-antitoxin system HicA family toxin [Thermus islandicus]